MTQRDEHCMVRDVYAWSKHTDFKPGSIVAPFGSVGDNYDRDDAFSYTLSGRTALSKVATSDGGTGFSHWRTTPVENVPNNWYVLGYACDLKPIGPRVLCVLQYRNYRSVEHLQEFGKELGEVVDIFAAVDRRLIEDQVRQLQAGIVVTHWPPGTPHMADLSVPVVHVGGDL